MCARACARARGRVHARSWRSLAYPARNACAPYCNVIWPLGLVPYLSALSHKRCDFRKQVIEHKMCVLIFSTTFLQNVSHFKKNLARYFHKCENVFLWSACYYCRILMTLEFSRQIFKKSLNIKFHQNSYSESRADPCGQTYRQTDGRI